MMVVSYEASGLQTLDEGVLFLESPVEFLLFVVPHAIEPDGSNRAIIGQKLSQLTIHESIIALPIRGGWVVRTVLAASCRIVCPLPIHVAVVEMEFEPLLSASLRKCFHHIFPVRSGFDDVIRTCLRCPHRKAVVMPAGKGDVSGACLFEKLRPFASIEEGRIETTSQLILEVAAYYSIPVLDLYRNSGISPEITAMREAYMPDGLHPNDSGHAIIARKLAAFLKQQ